MAITTQDTATQAFITRWSGTTASELATAQSFVIDLCTLLGVPSPHPKEGAAAAHRCAAAPRPQRAAGT